MKTPLLPLLLTLAIAPLTAQSKTDKVDFEKHVFPILEKNCVECHRETFVDDTGRRRRPKGRVMLDTRANIDKSKRGKLFVAGLPGDSLVMASITLPADDEDRMPPQKQGGPLAKRDIELIERWIVQGADFGDWTGETNDDATTERDDAARGKASGSKRGSGSKKKGPSPLVTLAKGLRPVPAETLAAYAGSPFQVRSVGDDSPLLLVSACGRTADIDDKAVQQLAAIAEHVFELDLARSAVADGACAVIAKMPRLTKLDLRQTLVSDTGIKQLTACKELRTLNLFDTAIGDYALLAIASLDKLEKLYVWQTDVSTKGIVRLREALPTLDVVTFADLPEPPDESGNGGRRGR